MSGGVIVGRQNRLLDAFEEGRATSPEAARSLEQLGCRESFVFHRMVQRGVFVQVDSLQEEDRWWMDQEAAASFVRRRHRIVLILMLLALVVGLALGEW